MSYNYSQYVISLAELLVLPPTDTDYLTILPNIIDDAEQRIYRELDLLTTIVQDSTGVLSAGAHNFTFPQHFVVCENILVGTPAGTFNNNYLLTPTTREFLFAVYGDNAVTGIPQYFAMITDQNVILGPTPDAAYNVQVTGTIRPAPLSVSNPTTYLTQYLPDLFLAASMVFAAAYLQNYGASADNPQMATSWESHYTSLVASANVEENRKKFASQAWSPKQPAPLATPPRA